MIHCAFIEQVSSFCNFKYQPYLLFIQTLQVTTMNMKLSLIFSEYKWGFGVLRENYNFFRTQLPKIKQNHSIKNRGKFHFNDVKFVTCEGTMPAMKNIIIAFWFVLRVIISTNLIKLIFCYQFGIWNITILCFYTKL